MQNVERTLMAEPGNHEAVMLGTIRDCEPWDIEVWVRDDANARESNARWYLTGTSRDGGVHRMSWDALISRAADRRDSLLPIETGRW